MGLSSDTDLDLLNAHDLDLEDFIADAEDEIENLAPEPNEDDLFQYDAADEEFVRFDAKEDAEVPDTAPPPGDVDGFLDSFSESLRNSMTAAAQCQTENPQHPFDVDEYFKSNTLDASKFPLSDDDTIMMTFLRNGSHEAKFVKLGDIVNFIAKRLETKDM